MDKRLCEWLMENADISIKYRVARELLEDKTLEKSLRQQLILSPSVIKGLDKLRPKDGKCLEHGSPDYFMENALPRLIHLGVHGEFTELVDAMSLYLDRLGNHMNMESYFGRTKQSGVKYRTGKQFNAILIANYAGMANIKDPRVTEYLLGSLNEMYQYASLGKQIEYYSEEERRQLRGVPKCWRDIPYFIRKEFTRDYGFSYPLNYDIAGLYRLYDLDDEHVTTMINTVIDYISSDEYHSRTADGYGVLAEEDGKYHAMGWDAKYPGWKDPKAFLENDYSARLLYYALCISHYPTAVTKLWFSKVREVLESYKTSSGTYIFPPEWLHEKDGYTIGGAHMSFGENRRKRKWCEIESTFFMQLLTQYEK